MLFTCPRCDYATSQRSSMRDHYTRKNPCPDKFSQESIEDLLVKFEESIKVKSFRCRHCNKAFYSETNLSKHQSNTCIRSILDTQMHVMNKRIEELEQQKNIIKGAEKIPAPFCKKRRLFEVVESDIEEGV